MSGGVIRFHVRLLATTGKVRLLDYIEAVKKLPEPVSFLILWSLIDKSSLFEAEEIHRALKEVRGFSFRPSRFPPPPFPPPFHGPLISLFLLIELLSRGSNEQSRSPLYSPRNEIGYSL